MTNIMHKARLNLWMAAPLALTMTVPTVAAQEAADDDTVLEEIVVTGYRGSLQRSINIKRNSDSIVDAISAEDLGKFPDNNVAETLQRIPGIAIERNQGEGKFVRVRGFAPRHTRVLINGRVIASEGRSAADGDAATADSQFSFDNLPAELISGATVYKTPVAHLQDGGIGGTVDIITARPFDYDGFEGSLTVKGNYDAQTSTLDPEISGLFSNTFADGRLGLLVAVSYKERRLENREFQHVGFDKVNIDTNQDGINEFTDVMMARWNFAFVDKTERERFGSSFAAQWQASDDLLLTVDGLYSKLDQTSSGDGISWWVGGRAITDATVNENNTVTSFTLASKAETAALNAAGGNFSDVNPSAVHFNRPRFAEVFQVGFNADWDINDQFNVTFDSSYSRATDKVGGIRSWFPVSITIDDDAKFTSTLGGVGEATSITGTGDLTDITNVVPAGNTFEGTNIADRVFQVTLDTVYDVVDTGWLTAVKMGVSFNQRDNDIDVTKTPDRIRGFGKFTNVPQDLLQILVDDGNPLFDRHLAITNQDDLENFLRTDPDVLATEAANNPAAFADFLANGSSFDVIPDLAASAALREETTALYIELHFASDDAWIVPWSGNVGLRYARTIIDSGGYSSELTGIEIVGDSFIPSFTEVKPISDTSHYQIVLPSANFKFDLRDDVNLRFAVAKTITRPRLTDLGVNQKFNFGSTAGSQTLQRGNPGLKPLIAWNYDVSLEWYINEASYLSAVYFYKDISGNTTQQTLITEVLGVPVFDTQPQNTGNSTAQGFELNALFSFQDTLPAPFDGLGVQGTYTYTDFDDKARPGDPVGLLGLSESYNLIAYYEKGPLQARVAYSWRASFTSNTTGARGNPLDIGTFDQFDASASFEILDGITLFAEGINLTNEKVFEFTELEERLARTSETGRRFSVGARMRF